MGRTQPDLPPEFRAGPRRIRWQWSLGGLMLLVAAVALMLAPLLWSRRQIEIERVRAIEAFYRAMQAQAQAALLQANADRSRRLAEVTRSRDDQVESVLETVPVEGAGAEPAADELARLRDEVDRLNRRIE